MQPLKDAAVACWPRGLVVLATTIHVRQLPEAAAPLVQVVIVLVLVRGRGGEGAQGGSIRAAALIVEHQQRVIGRGCGVGVSGLQVLWRQRAGG